MKWKTEQVENSNIRYILHYKDERRHLYTKQVTVTVKKKNFGGAEYLTNKKPV